MKNRAEVKKILDKVRVEVVTARKEPEKIITKDGIVIDGKLYPSFMGKSVREGDKNLDERQKKRR